MDLWEPGVDRLAEACGRAGDDSWRAALDGRLADLPPAWLAALALRYGLMPAQGPLTEFSVAGEMGIPVGEVKRMLNGALARLYLLVDITGLRSLAERTGYASVLALRAALRRLNPRERELLALLHGLRPGAPEGRRPAGVAREWGVSRQCVDQLHDAALKKLVRARERGRGIART